MPPLQPQKVYLGDSVYAEIEHGMIKLTTENGLPSGPSNTIFLEPGVYNSLVAFVQALQGNEADRG